MPPDLNSLSRREREIMEAVWRLGEATVAEVRAELAAPPTLPAIRSALLLLKEKGHVEHVQDGPRNVYRATITAERIGRKVVNNLVQTFFKGSPGKAVSAILGDPAAKLDSKEIARIEALLERHRRDPAK